MPDIFRRLIFSFLIFALPIGANSVLFFQVLNEEDKLK
jgi:hypothetical protein